MISEEGWVCSSCQWRAGNHLMCTCMASVILMLTNSAWSQTHSFEDLAGSVRVHQLHPTIAPAWRPHVTASICCWPGQEWLEIAAELQSNARMPSVWSAFVQSRGHYRLQVRNSNGNSDDSLQHKAHGKKPFWGRVPRELSWACLGPGRNCSRAKTRQVSAEPPLPPRRPARPGQVCFRMKTS